MTKERLRVYSSVTGTIEHYQVKGSDNSDPVLSTLSTSKSMANRSRERFSENELDLLQRINEVLHYKWDPCGVKFEPFARDEYNAYAIEVFRIVIYSDNVGRDISKYLNEILVNRMGLKSSNSNNDDVVRLILKHKEFIDTVV